MLKDEIKFFFIVSFICGIFVLVFGNAHPVLIYNQYDFHIWQLITAHFTHFDSHHLGRNLLALILMSYLFSIPLFSKIKSVLLAIALIDIYIYLSPIKIYAGYSGLLYILPGFACAQNYNLRKYLQTFLMLFIMVIYSLYSLNVTHISNSIFWQPLIFAHILGFIAGFTIKLLEIAIEKKHRIC